MELHKNSAGKDALIGHVSRGNKQCTLWLLLIKTRLGMQQPKILFAGLLPHRLKDPCMSNEILNFMPIQLIPFDKRCPTRFKLSELLHWYVF